MLSNFFFLLFDGSASSTIFPLTHSPVREAAAIDVARRTGPIQIENESEKKKCFEILPGKYNFDEN
jgi:hypothetical protein